MKFSRDAEYFSRRLSAARAEIRRLRELVKEAYYSGRDDGLGDQSDYVCRRSLDLLITESRSRRRNKSPIAQMTVTRR